MAPTPRGSSEPSFGRGIGRYWRWAPAPSSCSSSSWPGPTRPWGGAAGLAKSFGARPPALFSAFAGTRGANLFSPDNYIGFGFLHPLYLVLTLTVAISIGTAAVAGDIESGRVELLYTAGPVRRTTLLDARLGLWAVAQLAVVAAGVAGSWLGTRLTDDLQGVSSILYVRVAVQYLPLGDPVRRGGVRGRRPWRTPADRPWPSPSGSRRCHTS